MTSQDMILASDRAAQSRKLPTFITADHGTKLTSLVMDDWAHLNRVSLAFTRPGKPTDNGLCKSFNDRHRDEYLIVHEFNPLKRANRLLKLGKVITMKKSDGSLGNLTPSKHLKYAKRNTLKVARF